MIALGASPLISRLYSLQEFGSLGVFATTLTLLSVVAALRFDLAVPAAVDEREAALLLVVSLVTIGATTIGCFAFIAVGAWQWVPSLRASLPGNLVWWLPIGMLATGSYAALAGWMVRRRDYVTLGTTKVTQSLLAVVAQVGLGVAKAGATGLVVGQVAGSSAGLWRLARRTLQIDHELFHGITGRALTLTARTYRRFPLLSAPAVLLDSLNAALPLLFVAAVYGATHAGLLTMVQRILVAPLSLLTVNLGQIFFGDLAVLRRTEPRAMLPLFYRRLAQIAILGLVLLIVMVLVVPVLLPWMFGTRWTEAGTYFVLLTPMLFANFVSAPFGFVIDVLRRQDLHLLRDLIRTLTMGTAIQFAISTHASWHNALFWLDLAGVLNGATYLGVSWYALLHNDRATVDPSSKVIAVQLA